MQRKSTVARFFFLSFFLFGVGGGGGSYFYETVNLSFSCFYFEVHQSVSADNMHPNKYC